MGLEYATACATAGMLMVPLARSLAAVVMRQRVRYWSGGSPTSLLNRAAIAERDIATALARLSTVHCSAGRAWIRRSSAPMVGPATARRPHGSALAVTIQ